MPKTLNYNVKKRGGTWVLEDSQGVVIDTSDDPGRLQRQRQELYREKRALSLVKEGEGGSVSGGDATITTATGLVAHDLEGQRKKKLPRTRKTLSDPDGVLSPDEMADIALAMEKNRDGPDAAELIAGADESLRKTDKFKRCVKHVMDQGKSEDSAYAICTSVLGPHGRGKDRKKMRIVSDLRKFAPPGAASTVSRFFAFDMTKRDDEQRIVVGITTSERIDGQDEIVDSAAFKAAVPDFMEWANLREMHENKAAGQVLSIEPIDGEIEVDGKKIVNPVKIVAKILDEAAWEKVKSGVYKGFSIGGKVVDWINENINGKTVRRITDMILTEISLVDRPANEDARILMFKRATDDLPETIEIEWDQLGEGQYNYEDALTKVRLEVRPIPGGKFSVLIAKYDGAPVASFLADDLDHATLQAAHNLSVMRFRAGLAKADAPKSQERPEDAYLIERGFDPMEAPVDWREWDDKRLKEFPITRALLDYKRQEKKAGRWTGKAATAPLTKADKKVSEWEELPSGQLRATVEVTEDDDLDHATLQAAHNLSVMRFRAGLAKADAPKVYRTSMEEIEAEAQATRERRAAAAAAAAAAAEEEKARVDLHGFTDEMTPMVRARAEAALARNLNSDRYGLVSRQVLVENMISDGAKIETSQKGERRLMKPNGAFLAESQISKTGMEYAAFLLSSGWRKAATAPLTKAEKRVSEWEELPSGQLRATVEVTEDDGQTRTVYASVYKNVNGKWIGGVYYDASGNKPIKESAGQKEIDDAKAWVVEWARTEKIARPAIRKISVADFKEGATVTFTDAGEARKFFEALEKEANGGEELVDRPILNDVLEDFEKLGEGTLTVERARQAAIITVANADDSDGERIKVWLPESMMASKAARAVTIRKADDFPTAAKAFVLSNPVGVPADARKVISVPARLAEDFEAKKRDLAERRDAQALALAQRDYTRDLRDAVADARDVLEKIVADEKINEKVRQAALGVLALKLARAGMRKGSSSYAQITRREFIERHKDKFVRRKDKRNVDGILSDDGVTVWPIGAGDQRNGKLTRPIDAILGDVHQGIVAGAIKSYIESLSPFAPPYRRNAKLPPDDVLADYPDLAAQIRDAGQTKDSGKAARAGMRKYSVDEAGDVQHYVAITGYKVSRSDRRKLEAELTRQKKANPNARIEINVRGLDRASADIMLDVDGKTVLQVQGFSGQEIAYAARAISIRKAELFSWGDVNRQYVRSSVSVGEIVLSASVEVDGRRSIVNIIVHGSIPQPRKNRGRQYVPDLHPTTLSSKLPFDGDEESDDDVETALTQGKAEAEKLGQKIVGTIQSRTKKLSRSARTISIRKAQTYEFGRWQVDEAERMAHSIGIKEAPRVKDFIKTLQTTQDRTATLVFVVDEEKGYADVTLTNGESRKDARVTLGIVREKIMANSKTRTGRITRKAAFPVGLMDEVKEIINQEIKGWGAGGFKPADLSDDLLSDQVYNFETLPEGESLSDYFPKEHIDGLINEALAGVIKADADAAVAEYGSYKVKGTGFDTELDWDTKIGYADFGVWIHWDDDAWQADVSFDYDHPESWSERFDTLVEAAKYGYGEAERVQESLSEQGLETADVSDKAITDAVDKAVASFGDEGPDDLDAGVDQVLEIVRNDLEFYGTETAERIREEARRELERVYDYEAAAKPKMTKRVPAPKGLKRTDRTPAKAKAARPALRKEADWSSPGPGKFEGRGGKLAQRLYSELMEGGGGDETLDFGEGEVYDLILDNTGVEEYGAAFILTNDSNGFVGVQAYKSEAEARAAWAKLEAEYDKVMGDGDEYEAAAKPRMKKRTQRGVTTTLKARPDPVVGALRREVSKLNAALSEQAARLEQIERSPADVVSPYVRPAGKVEKRLPGQGNVLPQANPQELINKRFEALVELRRQAAVEPDPYRKADLNRQIIAEEMRLGTLGQGGGK